MKRRSQSGLAVLFFLLWALLISGCTPAAGNDQVQNNRSLPVSADTRIGQSFTAQQAGLMGVDLWLEPQNSGAGLLKLTVYQGPQAETPLANAEIAIEEIRQAGWQRILFDPSVHLETGDFYFQLETTGPGSLAVGAAAGASYLNGSAYVNDHPAADGQLAFKLVYRARFMAEGLLREGLAWLKWLGLACILFLLPGWGLMSAAWPGWAKYRWPEKLGVSIGISLAIYPLLILWTGLIGLKLGSVYAFLPAVLAAAWLIWKNIFREKGAIFKQKPDLQLADILFLGVMAVVIGVRFYAARMLPLPLWWDSIHHTTITQLLVDNGGLFNSWLPYHNLDSLSYHFGFHSAAAVFHWASGLDVPQSVLWFGQILNGLGVLAVYPLAVRLGRSPWAGTAAVLTAGLLGPLPMFYINWATYTLLAGITILAAIIWMSWDILENDNRRLGAVILTGLAAAGLGLTHYRVLIYIVFLYPVMLLVGLRKGEWRPKLLSILAIGITGAILFLPWFIHLLPGRLMSDVGSQLSTPASDLGAWALAYNNTIGPLTSFLSLGLWLLLPLAMGWAMWKRERLALVLGLWCLALALASNPNWIGLPGTGVLKNFSVLVGIYLPAAVIFGAAGGWLFEKLGAGIGRGSTILMLAAVVVLAFFGARDRLHDLQLDNFSIGTHPDVQAAEWVKSNLPADAAFLVNSIFTYGGSISAGTDGGWWLTMLTGRHTTQPPILYASEKSLDPNFAQKTNDLVDLVQKKGVTSEEVGKELVSRGIGYVYIGQRQGMAGNWTAEPPLLDVESLLKSPHFQLIYHQNRVYIFELKN